MTKENFKCCHIGYNAVLDSIASSLVGIIYTLDFGRL